jgi:hypothetical protein
MKMKQVTPADLSNPDFPLDEAIAYLVEFSGYTPKDARSCVMRHRHGHQVRTVHPDGRITIIIN